MFCSALPATTNVVQWGNASVWKVGGKIFTVCSRWGAGQQDKISFKCSDISYALLIEQDGVIPAPYLARAKWVQRETASTISDDDLKAYLKEAHKIIAAKLTKKQKKELGLGA
nr:MmcQ/YjbR family DNA-binding protein [Roseibium denhamense]